MTPDRPKREEVATTFPFFPLSRTLMSLSTRKKEQWEVREEKTGCQARKKKKYPIETIEHVVPGIK